MEPHLAIQNPDDSLVYAVSEQELQRIEERSPIFKEMEDLRGQLNRYEESINSLHAFIDNFRGDYTPITDPDALNFLEEVEQNGPQYARDVMRQYSDEIRVKQALSQEIVEHLDVLRRQVYPDGEIPFNSIHVEMLPSLNLFRAARVDEMWRQASSLGNATAARVGAVLRTSARETTRLAREAAQRARDAARLGRADNTYYYF